MCGPNKLCVGNLKLYFKSSRFLLQCVVFIVNSRIRFVRATQTIIFQLKHKRGLTREGLHGMTICSIGVLFDSAPTQLHFFTCRYFYYCIYYNCYIFCFILLKISQTIWKKMLVFLCFESLSSDEAISREGIQWNLIIILAKGTLFTGYLNKPFQTWF